MKLHYNVFSHNCRRVRATANALGIDLQLVDVDMLKGAQQTPEFLRLNPNGKIPVLEDGKTVLWSRTRSDLSRRRRERRPPTDPKTPRPQVDALGPRAFWTLDRDDRLRERVEGHVKMGDPTVEIVKDAETQFSRFANVLNTTSGAKVPRR